MLASVPGVLRYAAWRTALVLLVLLINPFGAVDGGDQLSHRVWQTIHADQYRKHAQASAIDQLTVVTLDDISMKAAAPPDTAPDSVHLMQIFRTLTQAADPSARPKALFIDLLLGDFAPDEATPASLLDPIRPADEGTTPATDRPAVQTCPEGLKPDRSYERPADFSAFKCLVQGIALLTGYADRSGEKGWGNNTKCFQNELAKLDCIVKAHGTPVIIASAINPAAQKAANPSAGAQALADVAISAPILVQEYGYALVYPDQAEKRENRIFNLYPAAILYAAWCRAGGQPCKTDPAMPPDRVAAARKRAKWLNTWRWSGKFERPMDVTWGVGKPDNFTNMTDSLGSGTTAAGGCRAAEDGMFATAAAFVKAWFGGVKFTRGTPCVYQHHVTYADLLTGLADPDGDAADRFRNAALSGKMLLIGMSTTESGDFIDAGPHQKLPGVYYHAMALDNLIERGADYPKMAYQIAPPLTITNQDCVNAFAAFLMFLAGGVVHQRVRHGRDRATAHPWRRLGVAGVVVLLVAAYMLLVLYKLTGQIRILPDQFNVAALSIVLVAEVIQIAGTLIRPLLRPLTADILRGVATQIEPTPDAPLPERAP